MTSSGMADEISRHPEGWAIGSMKHRLLGNTLMIFWRWFTLNLNTIRKLLFACLLVWWWLDSRITDSKVHGANMGPTWVLSAPDGPMLATGTLVSGIWCNVAFYQNALIIILNSCTVGIYSVGTVNFYPNLHTKHGISSVAQHNNHRLD